jgi:hypothetical protein
MVPVKVCGKRPLALRQNSIEAHEFARAFVLGRWGYPNVAGLRYCCCCSSPYASRRVLELTGYRTSESVFVWRQMSYKQPMKSWS